MPPDRQLRTELDLLIGVEIEPLQQIQIGNSGLLIRLWLSSLALPVSISKENGACGPKTMVASDPADAAALARPHAADPINSVRRSIMVCSRAFFTAVCFVDYTGLSADFPGAAKPACAASRKFAPHTAGAGGTR